MLLLIPASIKWATCVDHNDILEFAVFPYLFYGIAPEACLFRMKKSKLQNVIPDDV